MALTPYDKEEITLSSATVGTLDSTKVSAGGTTAVITVEAFECRFWVNGSTPTSSQGHELLCGDILTLDQADELSGFKAVNANTDGSHNCKLKVTYER